MNVIFHDIESFNSLQALEVATYLRSKGWTQQGNHRESTIWTYSIEDEQFETLVPLNQSSRDYALRMGDLIHTLAAVENRSQMQVYSDLQTTFADVVRIRVDDADLTEGTLPMEENFQLAQRARDLLMAAACAAIEVRPIWHKKPSQAIDHVRKIRIGQSERGSYVLKIISDVGPALNGSPNGRHFEGHPPYGRRVTQILATSLESLDRAAAMGAISGELTSFQESVANGVSANLCDAVAGMWNDDVGQRSVEFSFSWSPARPIDPNVPSRVRFEADRIPLIREASRMMKEGDPIQDFTLIGAVIKLDRSPGSVGKVTVMGQVDRKRVTVSLEEPFYHVAVTAHYQDKGLRCVGSLIREGRSYILQNPREITIVE